MTTTTFSQTVRVELEREPAPRFALKRSHARNWFKNFMMYNHFIMRASVPLMVEAEKLSDGGALREYYHKHIIEETHHDEWLLDDLQSVGIPKEYVLSRKPPQTVSELTGSQYYWIYHWHPVVLLGYIAFLEGSPPTSSFVDALKRATDYPEEAFRTIVKHSSLDPNHKRELNETLDSLPLSAQQREWIIENAIYSLHKFREIMKTCLNG